jgi:hypothetical protein
MLSIFGRSYECEELFVLMENIDLELELVLLMNIWRDTLES